MPLIKYEIGDNAKIYSSDCKCGCKDPVILLEQTREAEMIQGTNKNGIATFRKILRRLYFHDEIRDIIAIKIVQDDMWHFTVFVKKIRVSKAHFNI